ncbi:MAG: TonB-dependent receptor plug domain-containing protein [Bacteroidales bacterium]|nr:TonB-dependent receptor plug domain-containing protein [Bacteroidales bacterium]
MIKRISGLAAAVLVTLLPARAQSRDNAIRDSLEASRITAIRERMQNTTQTGLARISGKELNSGVAAFGTPDVIKRLQMMPGVASGNELSNGLYVHGGDGNDNLFLLDGVPLYNISHFGGLFSSFNTDVIDNLDFYKSGFPARYGGRMSSVVDVETREGDMERYHGSFSLGMIDGRIQLEGPIVKGKTSFNVGLRRSWMDVITIPAIIYANHRNGDDQTVKGGYSMSDFNARLTHRFAPGHTLNLNFYTGGDDLHAGREMLVHTEEEGVMHDGSNEMDIRVKWGSLTASVVHAYEFSKKLREKTTLYYSRSNSDTGYDFNFWSWNQGESITAMTDSDISYVREAGLTTNWDWYPNNYNHVRYGLSAQYHWYHSGREFQSSSISPGQEEQTSGDSESIGYRSLEPAVYAEDEIFIRYNLTANVGLRYALFRTDAKTWHSLEPRIALKWMLNKDITAKLSYTRMSQFAHLVAAMYIDLPSNSWMPSTNMARPMISDQIAGGIYTTPFKHFTFNLEGWYKTMDHLLVYNGSNSFVPPLTEWEKSFTEGKGESYGMEVEATYDNGPLTLSAYYTLSWTRRNFESFYPWWFPDRNDNRHKVNLVASWNFARYFSVFLNWNYHTGNRITFPSHVLHGSGALEYKYVYDSPYNTKLPDYHRLDFGADFTRTNDRGRTFKVSLNIYNLYNHLNAIMAFTQTDSDGKLSGMAYGLIPIIPTLSVGYKF